MKTVASKKVGKSASYVAKVTYSFDRLLKIQCVHQGHYSWNIKNVCDDMIILLKEDLKEKKIVNQDIKKFIEYIAKPSYYIHSNTCLNKNSIAIVPFIAELFELYIPSPSDLSEIVKNPSYDVCFASLEKNPEFKGLDEELVQIIINNRLKYSKDETNENLLLIDFIIKHMEKNIKNIANLCMCRNEYLSFILASIIDKFDGSIEEACLVNTCYALPYSKHTFHSLLGKGLQINDQHLNIVCANCDEKGIEFFLETSRMPILRKHYQALVGSKIITKVEKKSMYSKDEYKHITGYTFNKMEILIKYGYKPTYEDVLYAVPYKIEIPGIERFGIEADTKLLEECWKYDFYPSYNFKCITKQMIELEKLCNEKRIKPIRDTIKNNQLVPDAKCMENACGAAKNNHQIFDFLRDAGGKVNLNCIKKHSIINDNHFLTKIVSCYEKDYQEEINKYQAKIKKLENEIIKLGGSLQDPKKNQPIIVVKEEPKDTTKQEKEKENIIVKEENGMKNIPFLNMNTGKLVTIQKNNRLKSSPPTKFTEMYGGKNKMSFNDIKKFIIEKIKAESWIDKDDNNIINLPQNIADKLNINKQIVFADIDKLVAFFYD